MKQEENTYVAGMKGKNTGRFLQLKRGSEFERQWIFRFLVPFSTQTDHLGKYPVARFLRVRIHDKRDKEKSVLLNRLWIVKIKTQPFSQDKLWFCRDLMPSASSSLPGDQG